MISSSFRCFLIEPVTTSLSLFFSPRCRGRERQWEILITCRAFITNAVCTRGTRQHALRRCAALPIYVAKRTQFVRKQQLAN